MVIKPHKKVVIPQPRQFAGDVLPSVGVMSAKAESMLMGFVVPMDSRQHDFNRAEIVWYTSYILSVLKGETPADHLEEAREVYNKITERNDYLVRHMTTNVFDGMQIITYTLDNGVEQFPALDDKYGVYSFVHNITFPLYDEFGDSFFEQKANDIYHKVS